MEIFKIISPTFSLGLVFLACAFGYETTQTGALEDFSLQQEREAKENERLQNEWEQSSNYRLKRSPSGKFLLIKGEFKDEDKESENGISGELKLLEKLFQSKKKKILPGSPDGEGSPLFLHPLPMPMMPPMGFPPQPSPLFMGPPPQPMMMMMPPPQFLDMGPPPADFPPLQPFVEPPPPENLPPAPPQLLDVNAPPPGLDFGRVETIIIPPPPAGSEYFVDDEQEKNFLNGEKDRLKGLVANKFGSKAKIGGKSNFMKEKFEPEPYAEPGGCNCGPFYMKHHWPREKRCVKRCALHQMLQKNNF